MIARHNFSPFATVLRFCSNEGTNMTAKNRLLAEQYCSEQDAPAPDYALASAFLESLRNSRSGSKSSNRPKRRASFFDVAPQEPHPVERRG